MSNKPKPPYPWKSLLWTLGGSVLALSLILIAFKLLRSADPFENPLWLKAGSLILLCFAMVYSLKDRVSKHRKRVRQSREEWSEQVSGSAPPTPPRAQTSAETLLLPTVPDTTEEAQLLRATTDA